MTRHCLIAVALLSPLVASPGWCRSPALADSPLVDHPVSLPHTQRTPQQWRRLSGGWGENFTEQNLRLRGYSEVLEIKTGSNNGIDRVAVKRASDGSISDVRIVESKTHRGKRPKLGMTKNSGRQMSRKWMADRLRAMRRSSDEQVRKLAKEIYRFHKSSGQPLTAFGEVHDINTRTGTFSRLASDGATELSSESIERFLTSIADRPLAKESRRWATRSLAEFDQIRSIGMSSWLSPNDPSRAVLRSRPTRTGISVRAGFRTGGARILRRALARAAGPVALVVSVAVDGQEVYDTQTAYRSGLISYRDRNIRHTTAVGGFAGAAAGAFAGAKTGIAVGALGGPWGAAIGGAVGSAVGGVAGYIAGSAVSGYAASSWYDHIDAVVRDRAERSLLGNN